MDYQMVPRPAFTVAGISLRTSNAEPEKIGGLWQQFYSGDFGSRIPDKKSDDIYSLYMEYEGDHTQPYTLVIGYEASPSAAIPSGMVAKTVPAAKYAVFTAMGPQPQTVISIWEYVWSAGLQRTYSGDFDVYSSGTSGQQVSVWVAIG
jgi:predicted transcriptional regulator YdeE